MEITNLILRLLDLLVAGSIAYEQLAAMKAKLEEMKAEGRDPTPEEWDALFSSIETDSARLDAADNKLNP